MPRIGAKEEAVLVLSITCCGFFGLVVLLGSKYAINLYEETFSAKISPSFDLRPTPLIHFGISPKYHLK